VAVAVAESVANSSWHSVNIEAIKLASEAFTGCKHAVHCGAWAMRVGQKHKSSGQVEAAASMGEHSGPHCSACRGCKFELYRIAFVNPDNSRQTRKAKTKT
jgi:hypothetical protein